MSIIERFLADVDARWTPTGSARLRLCLIGSAALMLQAAYERGTKDSDIIETDQLKGETGRKLLALAGEGSSMHRRHRLYIDIVSRGLPFLPQPPAWHSLSALNASLRHLEIEVLDVVDVVVSKLKRFNANDVSDIGAMVDLDLVQHARLLGQFRSAVETGISWTHARSICRTIFGT